MLERDTSDINTDFTTGIASELDLSVHSSPQRLDCDVPSIAGAIAISVMEENLRKGIDIMWPDGTVAISAARNLKGLKRDSVQEGSAELTPYESDGSPE